MQQHDSPHPDTGIEVHAFSWPGRAYDAAFAKRLERFATAEEQVEHLIKTVRHLSAKIKDRDRMWGEKLKLAEHEGKIAVRRLQKAREKIKRLFLWSQNG